MNRFVNRTKSGIRLFFTGTDTLDLLHRITTADLADMPIGESKRTIILNEKGRIEDNFLIYNISKNCLLLVSDLMDPAHFSRLIEKYIIIEDANLQDASREFAQFTVIGTDASDITTNASRDFKGYAFKANLKLDTNTWELTVPAASSNDTLRYLNQFATEIDESVLRVKFIEQGIPRIGAELDTRVNPLEAGLQHLISFDKGCYVGQEVVARLDTYKKVKRNLMGIKSAYKITEGSLLTYQNIKAGQVCSYCYSKRFGHIALAYIRSEFATPATQLLTQDKQIINVVSLPFE